MYRVVYHFDWGDGQSEDSKVPTVVHSYELPKTYTVRVTAKSASPTIAATTPGITSEVVINIIPPSPPDQGGDKKPVRPRLTLIGGLVPPEPSQTVRVTTSWNAPVSVLSCSLDWGDKQSSECARPYTDHTYSAPDTYTIRAFGTVVINDNPVRVRSRDLTVTVRPPPPPPQGGGEKPVRPRLTLTGGLVPPEPSQTVRVTTSWDPPVSVLSCNLDWGDQQFTECGQPDAEHTYSAAGTYTIRAVATVVINDNPLKVRSRDLTVTVAPPPPQQPQTASLDAHAPDFRVGTPVTFTATLDPPPSSPVQYRFVFGDGVEQDSPSNQIAHSYDHADTFHAGVTALVGEGQPITSPLIPIEIERVQAKVTPKLNVTVVTRQLIVGKDILLEASLDPPRDDVRYVFNWNDDSPPIQAYRRGLAAHRYFAAGNKTVEVTAYIGENNRQPLQTTVIFFVANPSWTWPFTLGEWLLLIVAAGVAAFSARWIYNKAHVPRSAELHVRGYSGTSTHNVTRVNPATPHVSLTFKPGMDSAEHNMVLPKGASASK